MPCRRFCCPVHVTRHGTHPRTRPRDTSQGHVTGTRPRRRRGGGIDGIIKEDKLGLEAIYVQAKQWKGSVGRPEIQQFVGALRSRKKGVFITTGTFTKDAVEFASNLPDPRVVLVGGHRLAELMIEHNVGVSTVRTLEIKRVDGDYFDEA